MIETLLDDDQPQQSRRRSEVPRRPARHPLPWPLIGCLAMVLVGALAIVVAVRFGSSEAPEEVAAPVAEAPAPVTAAAPVAEDAPEQQGIAARVDTGWAEQTAAATGIPYRALLAYAGASLAVAETDPDCGVGWNTLAGIGWVESHHGTLQGSAIASSGLTRPAIVGPALDGSGVEAVADTDAGAVDGSAEVDRAVGPMQFLPQTWMQWGTDANGDGRADPQQIDDAALTAAHYLCDVGGDLTADENWIAAVRAYNSPIHYVNTVALAADTYAERAEQNHQ